MASVKGFTCLDENLRKSERIDRDDLMTDAWNSPYETHNLTSLCARNAASLVAGLNVLEALQRRLR
ncbi:MAG TPA: hypothetical protein VGW57_11825 [Chthoniobacterales bacterium]|nr:hypothetical protein [Chthoniobacterales bacterium]